ncbi:hypothetical protein D3C86_2047700 [compost metagenome]
MLGPPRDEPRRKGARVATTGNGQHAGQRQEGVRPAGCNERLMLSLVGRNGILNERAQVLVHPVARIGNTRYHRFFR